jgi:hypothetical protein
MGAAANPSGETIEIDSESMLWNGKRVVPVMGEIHYARVPVGEWRTELQKMKAGGINIIATYVFWIHHEEIKGQYDWTGQRDLRHFAETCKELGLKLVLRIGPWAHGEVRNGGFPDWLATSGMKLRQNNPEYLEEAEKWYKTVFAQIKGLLWKDGGTIIGIQIENEYRGRWEHLAKLKEIAVNTGFDVPLYTRTGWPALATPAAYGEIIPLYGDYPDGFWDRSLSEMPSDYPKAYQFRPFRRSTVIATEQLGQQSEMETREDADYPYFTCELGGGMMPSYHRRISIAPMDIYALVLVKIGSGSNLPGYYMYHGGTNPDGKLTYLNEIQATPMTNYNDLPVKTYDFQAPIGEFGQVNAHYYLLRNLHLFLQDFGEGLATMKPYFPENNDALRWCVRSDGSSGYVFVNNYERLKKLGEKKEVSLEIDLPKGKIVFPTMNIPEGAGFFFPFNMKIGDKILQYATAQPIIETADKQGFIYTFKQVENIPAHFLIDNKKVNLNKERNEYSFKWGGARIKIVLETETVPTLQPAPAKKREVEVIKISNPGELRKIPVGVQKVAESPVDKDFDNAAIWQITVPKDYDYTKKDIFLYINYIGDVTRLYSDETLLTDNFYNGKSFEINLRYFKDKIKDGTLILKILPLQKDAPIYLPVEIDFKEKNSIAGVENVVISK